MRLRTRIRCEITSGAFPGPVHYYIRPMEAKEIRAAKKRARRVFGALEAGQ